MEDTMKFERVAEDRHFTTMCISGLSVDEMNLILNERQSGLEKVMKNHGCGNTFDVWACGYGIYSIRHVGEHLLVEIGNSCD